MQLLFGRTVALSQSKAFADWWTSSLRPIHAKDSVQPASAKVRRILASYGLGCCGQLQLFNLASVSSRTLKDTSRLDSPQSLPIYKRLVIEWRREYSARLNAVRHSNANGSSCWPTANVPNGGRKLDPKTAAAKGMRSDGSKAQVGLENAVSLWATPRNNDAEKRGDIANDPRNGLPAQAKWATPRASEATKCPNDANGKTHGATLAGMASAWPTPTSRDYKDGSAQSCQNVPVNGLLGRFVHSTGQTSLPDQANSSTNGNRPESLKLNADWVCSLMDVPIDWVKAE
jgi:hypothetical protein